ncbi:hypothetical protein [Kingella potus]|uniref:hypothetical protein n=1 Tax=Kingella potus TaxID=265175 RepID=UPI0011C056CC|nr:hypothetical protein [Kingella potus]UOP01186.1 hypothetical protein LVJ84_02430 [Kingella potus]
MRRLGGTPYPNGNTSHTEHSLAEPAAGCAASHTRVPAKPQKPPPHPATQTGGGTKGKRPSENHIFDFQTAFSVLSADSA